ncbi:MAG: PEP-CTERM sorting domain-containing protein [Planctomycetaceae bacterium]
MSLHRLLCAVGLLCSITTGVMAGPFGLVASDPVSGALFNVSVDLVAHPPDPIVPPNPTQDLTDPTRPVFTQDVINQAVLTFALTGQNGETFEFTPVPLPPPQDLPLSLTLQFAANGNMGTTFDVFFDASFTLDGGQHPPVLSEMVSSPTDPCEVLYTLRFEDDPPFSVEVFMINPLGGNTEAARFSSVPEPGSLAIFAGIGVMLLVRRRNRSAIASDPPRVA